MKIALDFDGVITDIGDKICQAIQKITNLIVLPQQISSYRIPDSFGIVDSKIIDGINNEAFGNIVGLREIPGALDGINELKRQGYHIIIVTARLSPNLVEEWFKIRKVELPSIFIRVGDKIEEPFDVLVDDSPKKICELSQYIKQRAFLFTQPWNERCLIIDPRMVRIRGWIELLEAIKSMGELNE